MKNWYNYSWIEVIKKLESDEKNGLTSEKANELLKNNGNNRTRALSGKNDLIILNILKQKWFYGFLILLFLLVVSWNMITFCFCLAVLIASRFIYTNNLKLLQTDIMTIEKLDSSFCAVLRDGQIIRVSGLNLVPGDIVLLDKGRMVPADLRIIESKELKIKQTSVTGESYIVQKYETKIEEEDLPIIAQKNMAFKASIVAEGSGFGIVTGTGENTELYNIIKYFNKDKKFKSSLKSNMESLFLVLLVFAAVFQSIYIILHGTSNSTYILMGFLPIFIVIIFSIFDKIIRLILGKSNISIKTALTLEKAAHVDSIYIDKEKLLETDNFDVKECYSDGRYYYNRIAKHNSNENINRILSIAVLNNDARYEKGILKGNFIEKALYNYAEVNSVEVEKIKTMHRKVFNIEYDDVRKMKTTVNKVLKKYRANTVGSMESVIPKCTHLMKDGIEILVNTEEINKIKEAYIIMLNHGLDVYALSYRNFNYQPSLKENIESNMVFVGLIGIYKSIKEEAVGNIENASMKNIKTLIGTKESKLTAMAFFKNFSLYDHENSVLSGNEISGTSKDEIRNVIDKVQILSRMSGEDKTNLIEVFQESGRNTLSLGYKLKDIPILQKSNLCAACGRELSSTVKDLCDMFFLDCDLDNVYNFLYTSRSFARFFKNLLTYVFYSNLSNGFFIAFCSYFRGMDHKLIQLFWCNSIIINAFVFVLFLIFSKKFDSSKPCIIENEKWTKYLKITFESFILSIFISGLYILLIFLNVPMLMAIDYILLPLPIFISSVVKFSYLSRN